MEGPQFSTRAESKLYRSWGGDVIGMTNLQGAKLAREAELCFATLAMATDYDCWRTQGEVVDIDTVLQVLSANSELARQTVGLLAERAPTARGCRCRQALDGAIITERGRIPARRYAELAVIAGRVLSRGETS
jgi:5'-methylthioadenosine phosphorylase